VLIPESPALSESQLAKLADLGEERTADTGDVLFQVFLFLGARPCTEWLDESVDRDDDGFILTGATVGGDHLLETSVPGVFAAGDVRAGGAKRCAAAVGEGAMVVQFVHARIRERASA
jgi:thioredoxin reductase (NADPH)